MARKAKRDAPRVAQDEGGGTGEQEDLLLDIEKEDLGAAAPPQGETDDVKPLADDENPPGMIEL